MFRTMTLALAPLTLALTGCPDADDADDGAEDEPTGAMPYCEDTATALAPEDEALGTTGAAFLEGVPAEGAAAVQWADGPTGAVAHRVAVDTATLRFVESVEVYPETHGPSPSIAVYCPDYIAVDAVVQLDSDDGRLAEGIDAVLVLDEDQVASGAIAFSAALDPDAMGGTLDLSDFLSPDDYDRVSLSLWASFQDGALSATLSAQGEGTDGDVAFAENIDVATIGGDAE